MNQAIMMGLACGLCISLIFYAFYRTIGNVKTHKDDEEEK